MVGVTKTDTNSCSSMSMKHMYGFLGPGPKVMRRNLMFKWFGLFLVLLTTIYLVICATGLDIGTETNFIGDSESIFAIVPDATESESIQEYDLIETTEPVRKRKRIVLTTGNGGNLDFMVNWQITLRASMRDGDEIEHMVIVEDCASCDLIRRHLGEKHTDCSRCSNSVSSGALWFGKQDYVAMMLRRPEHIKAYLDQGYDVLFSDSDVVFIDHPWAYFDEQYESNMQSMMLTLESWISIGTKKKDHRRYLVDVRNTLRARYQQDSKSVTKPLGEAIAEYIFREAPEQDFLVCACMVVVHNDDFGHQLVDEWAVALAAQDPPTEASDQDALNQIIKTHRDDARIQVASMFKYCGGFMLRLRGCHNPRWVHINWTQGHDNKLQYLIGWQLYYTPFCLLDNQAHYPCPLIMSSEDPKAVVWEDSSLKSRLRDFIRL
eukprot:Clim_evm8s209 gene=Clim_evmTU8s209